MRTYNLINKSEDSIIIYNIKTKNRDQLIEDIDFFNKNLKNINLYKEKIKKIEEKLNILIQKETNKIFKTGKKLEQLNSDLIKYNNLDETINNYINKIKKIKKFTEYIFNGIQNSREIPKNSTPILNSNPILNYNFKSNVDKNLRTKYLNRKNRKSKGLITNKPINEKSSNPQLISNNSLQNKESITENNLSIKKNRDSINPKNNFNIEKEKTLRNNFYIKHNMNKAKIIESIIENLKKKNYKNVQYDETIRQFHNLSDSDNVPTIDILNCFPMEYDCTFIIFDLLGRVPFDQKLCRYSNEDIHKYMKETIF